MTDNTEHSRSEKQDHREHREGETQEKTTEMTWVQPWPKQKGLLCAK